MGKRGPEPKHDSQLHIVLPAKLKLRLFKAAIDKGVTVSEWLRELVEQALAKP